MEMDPITIFAIVGTIIVSFIGWYVDKNSKHERKHNHK